MTTRLTILGVSARAAAQAAHRAGIAPYSIDLFADRDTATVGQAVKINRYPEGFLAALRESPRSPWMYTGGLENYPDLVAELAQQRPLLGNRAEALRKIRNPIELQQVLATHDFCYPSVDSALGLAARVFKPLLSGGGRGVRLIPAGDSRPFPVTCHQQRFVEGVAASALYIASARDCRLIATSRQLVGQAFGAAEPFGYVGSIAPLDGKPVVIRQFENIGAALTNCFGLQGVFGIDVVLQDDRVWVLEVNPRLTASAEVVERATGCNPVAQHVSACLSAAMVDADHASVTKSSGLHGKAIVYARSPGIAGDHLSTLIGAWNATDWPAIADLPVVGSQFRTGEPVATVFAAGPTEAEVLRKLRSRSDEVLSALDPA